jgi:threonine/homoserine/homoserine lactone efflux protein
MLLDVIGALLPAAAGIALSPIPLVAVIVVVSGGRGAILGVSFAAGWVLGLTALTGVAVAVGELVGSDDAATWASLLRMLLGGALVVLGVRTLVRSRSAADGAAKQPGWLQGIGSAGPGRTAAIGAAVAALNPKNVAFALASASVIGQVDQDASSVVIEAAVFVLMASSGVLGIIAFRLIGGDRSADVLSRLHDQLLRHHDAILAAVLLLIGANIFGGGLAGLG